MRVYNHTLRRKKPAHEISVKLTYQEALALESYFDTLGPAVYGDEGWEVETKLWTLLKHEREHRSELKPNPGWEVVTEPETLTGDGGWY